MPRNLNPERDPMRFLSSLFHPSARELTGAVALSFFVIASLGSEAAAQSDALPLSATPSAPSAASDSGHFDLAISPEYQRAVRIARTGGALAVTGTVGMIISAVVIPTAGDCSAEDTRCWNNGWGRMAGGVAGLFIGAGFITAGLITVGVGVRRRNRLRSRGGAEMTLGFGPASLRLTGAF